MKLKYIIKLTLITIIRYRKKFIISTLINSLTILLLLISISVNTSVNNYISNELNNLDNQNNVRGFTLKTNSEIENIESIEHINSATIVFRDSSNIIYNIIVDDYSNLMNLVNMFESNSNYEVILEERNLINIEIIKVVRKVSTLSLIIIIIVTYFSFFANNIYHIYGKKYDIALYKTQGYQNEYIFKMIFIETIFLALLSYCLALIGNLIFNNLSTLAIFHNDIVRIIIENSILDFNVVVKAGLLSLVIVIISVFTSFNKIKKIHPMILLKNQLN